MYPGQLLLAADFDGTLAPIVCRPDAARALAANLALIDRLIELGVAVISGRAQDDLRERVPIRGSLILDDNGIGETTRAEQRALIALALEGRPTLRDEAGFHDYARRRYAVDRVMGVGSDD